MDIYEGNADLIKKYLEALGIATQYGPNVSEEVKAQINLLTSWIALELHSILPPDITLEADNKAGINGFHKGELWGGTSIGFLYNNPSDFGYMAEKAFSDLQDFITEFTTNIFPSSDVIKVRDLPVAQGVFQENTVYARYRYEGHTIFEMTPLNLLDPTKVTTPYDQDAVWKSSRQTKL